MSLFFFSFSFPEGFPQPLLVSVKSKGRLRSQRRPRLPPHGPSQSLPWPSLVGASYHLISISTPTLAVTLSSGRCFTKLLGSSSFSSHLVRRIRLRSDGEAQSSRRRADAGPSSRGAVPVGTSLCRATPRGSCERGPGGAAVLSCRYGVP